MEYQYGASFNCVVGIDDAIGGGEEGVSTMNYLSNDLEKLKTAMLVSDSSCTYKFVDDHELMGRSVDMGGYVVEVMISTDDLAEGEDESEAPVVAVIFDDPEFKHPTII